MTELERDIGLVLLKRLLQRGFISEAAYIAACNFHPFTEKSRPLPTESARSPKPKPPWSESGRT